MELAELDADDTLSNDVLFPEDTPHQVAETESIYSNPSTYSSHSREDNCVFPLQETSFLRRRGRHAIYQKHSEYGFVGMEEDVFAEELTQPMNLPPDNYAPIRDTHYRPPPIIRPKPRSNSYTDGIYGRRRRLKVSPVILEDSYTVPNKPPFPRRHTWSPPPIQRHCSVTSSSYSTSYGTVRNYGGKGNADGDNSSVGRENVDIKEPANLPPKSGVLNQSPDKVVLRPLAFKPVMPSKHNITPPIKPPRHEVSHSLSDEGYSSQDYRFTDAQLSPANHGSGQNNRKLSSRMRDSKNGDNSLYGAINKVSDRPGSQSSSSRQSSNPFDGLTMTPSPSDSGVSELEVLLREKDALISQLRETMDQNERVIFQVLEEKQVAWELELSELRRDCRDRVKSLQQKSMKTEQSYMLQVYKLQQENKQSNDAITQAANERTSLHQKCKDLENELSDCRSEVETVKWDLHQKSGEVSLLKSQLKDTKDEISTKNSDALLYKTQIKDLRDIINGKNIDIADMDKELANLKELLDCSKLDMSQKRRNSESKYTQTRVNSVQDVFINCESVDETVLKLRAELLQQREHIEIERERWLEEKNKVICYQKQLQLNYVQMYRKNKILEADIEQLTLDLERRDMQLTDIVQGEGSESAC